MTAESSFMCCKCERIFPADQAIDCGSNGLVCDDCACVIADEEQEGNVPEGDQ